jgi:predicted Zn-ribbon and HTH transcriptional regulator
MNTQKLVAAYSDFMHHLHESMETTLDSFIDAFENSKEKMQETSDFTKEEIDTVSTNVKRDVTHAAKHLPAQDNNSLSEWLKFDIELLETLAWDAFLSVADKTRIELAKIEHLAETHEYQSGDITMAGTFACNNCGKAIAFKAINRLPPCPACHHHKYVRQ